MRGVEALCAGLRRKRMPDGEGSGADAIGTEQIAAGLTDDRLYLSRDGKTGYALDSDGHLHCLFNNGPARAIDIALAHAIEHGALTLEAFDGRLPLLCARHGFKPTGRVKTSRGHRDLVFMALCAERPHAAGAEPYFTGHAVAKRASRTLLQKWDESQHPRDPAGTPTGGQFTSGDGGGAESAAPDDAQLDPVVVEVGGDAWNRATARRLEREYQAARPKLEALTSGAGAGSDDTTDDEDDEEPVYVPESWDELSDVDQDAIKESYFSQKLDEYVQSEHDNWYQNGGALDEAKATLAGDDGFAEDAIKKYLESHADKDEQGEASATGFEQVFTPKQLGDAIKLTYDSDGEGGGDLEIEFDDEMLQEPAGYDPNQMTLPGIEPEDPSQRLTEKMRKEITEAIEQAFDDKASDMQGGMEPPEYLAESAKEYMEENWDNGLSDEQKFEFAKYDTDVIKNLQEMAGGGGGGDDEAELASVSGLPDQYDPLNKTSGLDYKKTQKLARMLSIGRAEQVLKERDLPYPGDAAMRQIDTQLWRAWKESSTSLNGQLLQVAVADELGGRLNTQTGRGGTVYLDKVKLASDADRAFAGIGGYDGVRAYVRAKWETTQFLLDKAGIKELELYRGIALDTEKYDQAEREKWLAAIKQMVGSHAKVPNLTVVRNGAASTTINPSVANDWSSDSTRVVLRALMPRTAAVSIPAYGINVKSEQEVVVAGTAWKAWDAWLRQAPTFKNVAMAA